MISFRTALFFITLIALNAMTLAKKGRNHLRIKEDADAGLYRSLSAAYFTTIEDYVDSVFDSEEGVDGEYRESGMPRSDFSALFKKSSYGVQTRKNWENNEAFVNRYFDFASKGSESLKASRFFWTASLYMAEGALVAANLHPKLTAADGFVGAFNEDRAIYDAAVALFKLADTWAVEQWEKLGGTPKVTREQLQKHFNESPYDYRILSEKNNKLKKYTQTVDNLINFFDFANNGSFSKDTFRILFFNFVLREEKYLAKIADNDA